MTIKVSRGDSETALVRNMKYLPAGATVSDFLTSIQHRWEKDLGVS